MSFTAKYYNRWQVTGDAWHIFMVPHKIHHMYLEDLPKCQQMFYEITILTRQNKNLKKIVHVNSKGNCTLDGEKSTQGSKLESLGLWICVPIWFQNTQIFKELALGRFFHRVHRGLWLVNPPSLPNLAPGRGVIILFSLFNFLAQKPLCGEEG